jgi:hypothetical protein
LRAAVSNAVRACQWPYGRITTTKSFGVIPADLEKPRPRALQRTNPAATVLRLSNGFRFPSVRLTSLYACTDRLECSQTIARYFGRRLWMQRVVSRMRAECTLKTLSGRSRAGGLHSPSVTPRARRRHAGCERRSCPSRKVGRDFLPECRTSIRRGTHPCKRCVIGKRLKERTIPRNLQ